MARVTWEAVKTDHLTRRAGQLAALVRDASALAEAGRLGRPGVLADCRGDGLTEASVI
jgi:hypothetical protein